MQQMNTIKEPLTRSPKPQIFVANHQYIEADANVDNLKQEIKNSEDIIPFSIHKGTNKESPCHKLTSILATIPHPNLRLHSNIVILPAPNNQLLCMQHPLAQIHWL